MNECVTFLQVMIPCWNNRGPDKAGLDWSSSSQPKSVDRESWRRKTWGTGSRADQRGTAAARESRVWWREPLSACLYGWYQISYCNPCLQKHVELSRAPCGDFLIPHWLPIIKEWDILVTDCRGIHIFWSHRWFCSGRGLFSSKVLWHIPKSVIKEQRKVVSLHLSTKDDWVNTELSESFLSWGNR